MKDSIEQPAMRRLIYLVVPTILMALWWGLTETGTIPAILLPSPGAVARDFVDVLQSGVLAHNIASSAFRSLTGFAIAASAGLVLGVLFAKCRVAYQGGYLLIEAFRVIPPLSLIPLLILWLGLDEAPKIAIVFLSSFFPIYLNTLSAVRSVDRKLIELAQVLHFSPSETLRYLTIPAALPGILTGLRIGFGYSWRALVGAELVAATSGLGFMISESAEFSKTENVFVGIFTIAALGVAADAVLKLALVKALRHRLCGRSL